MAVACSSEDIFLEWLALGAYVLYMYFSYCDGFGLKPGRKVLWGAFFVFTGYLSLRQRGHFDLPWMILFGSLLAFALGQCQLRDTGRKDR